MKLKKGDRVWITQCCHDICDHQMVGKEGTLRTLCGKFDSSSAFNYGVELPGTEMYWFNNVKLVKPGKKRGRPNQEGTALNRLYDSPSSVTFSTTRLPDGTELIYIPRIDWSMESALIAGYYLFKKVKKEKKWLLKTTTI